MNLRSVHVVVPAHDEEQRIGDALASIRSAVDAVRRIHPGLLVSTTVVPESWLLDHVRLAVGHDLVVRRVSPEASEIAVETHAEWGRRHSTGALHVHGANLGFRLSGYDTVGGFAPVREHEDVLLVEAMQRHGLPWRVGTHVVTSARRVGRTPGGFARYLAVLASEMDGQARIRARSAGATHLWR